MTTTYGTHVPSGPSAFAQAQSRATMGLAGPTARRPQTLHLRGSLMRADAQAAGQDWSATGDASPAEPPVSVERVDLSDPSTPVGGAPLSDLMVYIQETYEINVQEAEHLEWASTAGIQPTVGAVMDACEALNLSKRPTRPTMMTRHQQTLGPKNYLHVGPGGAATSRERKRACWREHCHWRAAAPRAVSSKPEACPNVNAAICVIAQTRQRFCIAGCKTEAGTLQPFHSWEPRPNAIARRGHCHAGPAWLPHGSRAT